MIVVDASLAAAWYLEPDHPLGRSVFAEVLGGGAMVPGNFFAEVAQSLLRATRLGRIRDEEMHGAVESLALLDIAVEPATLSAMIALASKHSLSSYDAGYLCVAKLRGVALATIDAQLARAAQAEGCLWSPPPGGAVATEKRFSLLLAI